MTRNGLALLAVFAVGCGGGVEAYVAANVRVHGLLADDVASMSIYVLGPKRSDDIFLTCGTLMTRAIRPTDSKIEILAREDIAFSDPEGYSATLTDVEAGENRFVYIDALDAADSVIGNGCTDTVTVKSGEAADVEVLVYPL